MKHRKLRIAWSVVSGVVALSLVALWVRSYSALDYVHRQNADLIQTSLGSDKGRIFFAHFSAPVAYENAPYRITGPHGWQFVSRPPVNDLYDASFAWTRTEAGESVRMPHWCIAVLAALIGGASWLPWHFCLRSLLIAMTLVAVGLGIIVLMTRAG